MSKRKKKPKIGRPPTERGAYNPHPARQLGRVSDEDWKELQEAGQPNFTKWALRILLTAARRQRRRGTE